MDHKLTLLLITSDLTHKAQLTRRIESLQLFEIDAVPDSTYAIEKLKKNNYHFIISDIAIGQVDGWCLTSLIRSDIYKCDKKIPIVLMTDTHCERIAEATAKSFGINAILTKGDTKRVNEILADAFSLSLPINTRLKALMVIEDESICVELKRLLSSKFDTFAVPTAKEGLAYLRQNSFDFIIIDSDLEGESAIALMQTIQHEHLDAPNVVIVPRHNFERAEYFVTHGASDFIYNPFNPARVLNICERAAQRNDFMISNAQFALKVDQLEESEKKFRELSSTHSLLLENISSVILELDASGSIHFINAAWEKITGFEIKHTIGHNLLEFIELDDLGANAFTAQLSDLLLGNIGQFREEVQFRTTRKQTVWAEIRLHRYLKDDEQFGLAATIDNINDRKKAEEKLNHLALHDTLTGLYNRYYFDTELNRLTLLASRGNERHSLLYIDLDHFKVINDTEGHQTGDMVLKEVSQILSHRLRHSDILCRVGGDEFVILLVETEVSDAVSIGNEICHYISNTHFQFGNNSYKISASIGVSEIDGNATAAEYLRQADIALYVAKNKGRNQTHRYTQDDSASKEQLDNIKWVHRLQEAVVNDNLVLHYQPVWDIEEHRIAYFEALVRLEISGKLTYPNEFIPALERAEDINLLDHQVISKAIKTLSISPELHKIAINLSAQAFSDERLLPLIQEKLAQYQVTGDRIIFELTESASLTNVSGTQRMIEQLTAMGCEFSIDDFGTGFSTFAYLKQLPAHSVKIDGSFVKDMCKSDADKSLVSAIANVALALGKQSVAEFVENEDIFSELEDLGVRYAQGYFISKPLPLAEVKQFEFAPC